MSALPTFPDDFNLADHLLFDRLAEGLGDKAAVLFGGRRYTYADVAERARALAGYLARAGVGREERVLVVLPGRLSRHKAPRWVVIANDLPKNDRGKVDRKTLKAREARGENPRGL
jgi:acyl-CoA synthetase (AMP-forming)/AMP-acid ligase II